MSAPPRHRWDTVLLAFIALLSTLSTAYFAFATARLQSGVTGVKDDVKDVHGIVNSKNDALVSEIKKLNERVNVLTSERATLTERERGKGDK